MSQNFIENVGSKNILPYKSESRADCMRRLTHLYLNDKGIRIIGDLSPCSNLTVLYLQNNFIFKLENLSCVPLLKQLFLQGNHITKMENFEDLLQLEKLYISHNKISVLEGLDNNTSLKELHIQKQRTNSGNMLCFDPRSIYAMSNLCILDVSGTGINSLTPLKPLHSLEIIRANGNLFPSPEYFVESLQTWIFLKEAEFKECPACKLRTYKETIIGNSHMLEMLDGKPVSYNSRVGLHKLLENKIKAKIRAETRSHDKYQDTKTSFCKDMVDPYISLIDNASKGLPSSPYMSWNSMPNESSRNTLPKFLRKESHLKGSAKQINP